MNLENWKKQLHEKPQIGCFVTFASPAICEWMARLGFDFTLIDNEHGNIDQSVVEDMVRASQAAGVPSIVRVTTNKYDHVQKALDMGANGVQIPMINSMADAREVVRLANFPPVGERGTAYLTRAANYGLYPDKTGYLKLANETKFTGIHIETTEAVNNLDELLSVDEIDMYFIGPGDLSSSMGLAPGHEEVWKVTEDCIRKIRQAGKIAGTFTGDVASTQKVIDWGAHYVVTAINGYVNAGVKQFLEGVRG